MARPKLHDGVFRAVVPVRHNIARETEVEVPIVLARNADQAEVFAHMAVRAAGFHPRSSGTRITAIQPEKK